MKKHYIIPAVLLVYLGGIAVYTYPERKPDISWMQYGLTIGITFVCIVILAYLLKRREVIREDNKRKREENKKR